MTSGLKDLASSFALVHSGVSIVTRWLSGGIWVDPAGVSTTWTPADVPYAPWTRNNPSIEAIQFISFSGPNSGSFVLSIDGHSTVPINYNDYTGSFVPDDSPSLKSKLAALPGMSQIGVQGQTRVSSGNIIYVQFIGYRGQPALLTVSASTGITANVTFFSAASGANATIWTEVI